MGQIDFFVDIEKCIHCGQCEKECAAHIIHQNSEKFPHILKEDEKYCLKCQHCLAICPTGAISILGKKPQNSEPIENLPTPEQVLKLIQSRRSIRNYKKENLNPDTMNKLKNMLKYSPTGCNHHKLHIAIVENIEIMDKIRNRVNNTIKKLLLSKAISPLAKKFERYKNAFMQGKDLIFRDAPHMIVVSSPINAPCANTDPTILLSYFELYAQSLGVGTVWCGFGEKCLKLMPEICEYIGIPQGYKVGYVMLFGPTDTKYQRTTQPQDYQITTVTEKENLNISFTDKVKRYFWNTIR